MPHLFIHMVVIVAPAVSPAPIPVSAPRGLTSEGPNQVNGDFADEHYKEPPEKTGNSVLAVLQGGQFLMDQADGLVVGIEGDILENLLGFQFLQAVPVVLQA